MWNPVYAHVIGDVVGKLRENFVNQGVDDVVLDHLQEQWELKLMTQPEVIPLQPDGKPDHRAPAVVPAPSVYEASTSGANYVQEQYPATNQRPSLGVDLNVAAYEDSIMPPGKRPKQLDSPQQDGSSDPVNNLNLGNPEGEEDYEPDLNEDDDLLDQEEEDEERNINQLILAQYVKKVDTPKSSNKWRFKCTLKDGILQFNGRDILFSEAKGDFDY